MFCQIFKRRVKSHAEQVFEFLLPHGFDGEIFLCGGAYKPLLKKGAMIHDLDLWLRHDQDRERLCRALMARGATRVPDATHPHALKFRLEGRLIEVTCNAVQDASLADVVHTYELAVYGMGVRFQNGTVAEVCVSEECWHAIWHREMSVMPSYVCMLMMLKPPCLIRTLHRMGQEAAELGYGVHADEEHRLWEIYWHDYTEEERKLAMDLYFETTVSHKTQHHYHVVRRATIGLVKSTPESQTAAAANAALAAKQMQGETRHLRPRVA